MTARRLSALLGCTAAAAAGALVLVPALSTGHPLPGAPHCEIFPANNPWNQRVDRLPVARDSARIVSSIGADVSVHPDFGTVYNGAPNGIPYAVVSNRTRRVPVSFDYSDESDHGRYPLPRGVPIEGGSHSSGDRHVIVINKDTCIDYELYAAYPQAGGSRWHAGSGAIFNLRSNHLRPAGWTSADAAGLPIFPGLARYDEVAQGSIDHALRFTVERTRNTYVYPARHEASSDGDPSLPPMGLRVRLKANVTISRLPRQARIVALALKRYGMIVADNGSNWYLSGAPSPHWSDDQLHQLDQLHGSDFEVVDTSSLPHPR
jgi:hypothetical protein